MADWMDGDDTASGFANRRGSWSREGVEFLEHAPVLPGTLLRLELLLHEAQVDVRVATELVLNDVGAVIQILNQAGNEDSPTGGLPDRIAECLVDLDLGDLLNSLYSRSLAPGWEHGQVAAVWEHRVAIARYASITAESTGAVAVEDAYLAGLLDDRGAIAEVLEWPLRTGKHRGAGELLCAAEKLPRAIVSAFGHAPGFRRPRHWKHILETARQLAGPLAACARSRVMPPRQHLR
jgi:hypothetical protein